MLRTREEAGLLLFLLLRFDAVLSGCPKSCTCTRKGNKLIADCKDRGLEDIIAPRYLANISTLDLSGNEISSLPNKAFGRQKTLKKLLLSRNKISTIETGAFSGLSRLSKLDLRDNKLGVLNSEPFKGLGSLKTLDLSGNELNYINFTVFNGLKKLRKLILSSNKFIIIPEATLKPLESLKNVDLSSNDLLCDCHVKWLIKLKKNGVSVKGTCAYPEPLEFNKIADISPKNLRCDNLQLPFYLFKPNNNEVGIKGDSFTYTCGTTWFPGLKIKWYKNNKLLIPDSRDLRGDITFKADPKAARLTTKLNFRRLDLQDTGVYKCVVSSDKASKEGKSSLLVLPGGSKYCHAEITKTKKGNFQWDNVAVGSVAQLPCPAGTMRVSSKSKGVAYRKCSVGGKWMDIEADDCGFVDALTQQLYDLKQSALNSTNAITICKALLRITRNTTRFSSDLDVTYAADILDRIRPYMSGEQQIGQTMVHIVSNLMNVEDSVLAEAQKKSKACSSLVLILEEFANTVQARTTLVASNVAMSTVIIYPATYKGKTCAALRNDKGQLNAISCNLFWQNASTFSPSKRLLEASLHLPKYMFVGRVLPPTTEVKLRFTVYKNSKLFPRIINGSLVNNPRVVSSVVHVRIGTPLYNLTQPIAIKYHMDQRGFSSPISAYWKQSQQAGIGAWLENKDCILNKESNNTITHCKRLVDKTYFAILMSVDKSSEATRQSQRDGFVLEPLVYVGAAVCVLLLLITLITYAVFRKLRYNRDDSAMLMNLCLALLVTVVVFVAGIYHVTNALVCRAVGVLLHYFLLCSLLWIGCGGLCLCRLIRTAITPEEFNPVLRYYMISWGIPLIICGITVAGNPDNYSVDKYCWLKPNPFLGAFVGPACLVILIDIIMFIRLNNLALKTYDSLAYEKHVFQTEPEEEPIAAGQDENLPEQIASKCELIQQMEEALPPKEEIFVYQKGSLLVLLMILVNFALGFLLVRFQHSRYLNVALSCAYAVANITLGLIIFLFHCFKNKRAKQYWIDLLKKSCWKKKYVLNEEEETHRDKVTTALVNGDAVRENGTPPTPVVPQINPATATPVPSDIQSNVSLPLSTTLVVDIPINYPRTAENGGQMPFNTPASPPGSDKHSITTSMSDKQSCVSAPLPLSHTPQNINQHPPGFRYSYCVPEMENKKKGKKKKERIPLAIPEKNLITSSRESSMKVKNEENGSRKPSQNSLFDQARRNVELEIGVPENAPSELSSQGPGGYLDVPFIPYSSCASSGVSVPAACDLQPRPPVPGARSGGNHYPYGPGNFNYMENIPMQAPYPKNLPEERYVTIPQRPNGVVRQRPQEHVYESINEPPQNGPTNTGNPQPSQEQNGHNRPDNEIPYTENNPLLPPPRGTHLNGPSNDNLPRKRPRRNSDKSRTRRSREVNSQPKRRHTSSLPPHRTSASSLKPERVKPEPKEWIADPVPRLTYVPVPHLNITTAESRNETSV